MRAFTRQDSRSGERDARPRVPRSGPAIPHPRRPHPPRTGSVAFSAMGQPVTRRAFRREGARRLAVAGAGVGLWAATGGILGLVPDVTDAPVQVLCLGLVAAGAVAVAGGLAALVSWGHIGWVLRTHAWSVWDCPEPPVPGSAPGGTPIFLGEARQHRLVLAGYGWRPEWFADGGTVWLAGTPEHGGVLSPDGGEHLLWVRPAGVR